MKKLFVFLIILTLIICGLTACSANKSPNRGGESVPSYPQDEQDTSAETQIIEEPTLPNRKIMYEADATINTDDVQNAVKIIKQNIMGDEWFDEERISESNAYLAVRIKTQRLDAFLQAIAESGTISNLYKKGTDISLTYADNESRIATLQAEKARLVELYQMADNISEMIPLNQRISEIEREIQLLQGILNNYDSLVEYSVVRINIYQGAQKAQAQPFKQQINNLFKGAWNALATFLKWILMAVTAVFPFAVVFVPVGVGVFFANKAIQKKRKASKAGKQAQKPAEKQIKAAQKEIIKDAERDALSDKDK